MLITIRIIAILLATIVLRWASPALAAAPPAGTIAESMFLCDALPPGGRDLNLAVAIVPASDASGAGFTASPRVQLAVALGERTGLTTDVGLGTNGAVLDAPGASLKLLLRSAAPGRTGLALSLDVYGGSHALSASEAGAGLGAIRSLGRFTVRAGGSVATTVTTFSPRLHGGVSAALPLGGRVRVLGEVVGMSAHATSWAAGPSVKVALGAGSALSSGVLVPFSGAAPTFTVQLAQGL